MTQEELETIRDKATIFDITIKEIKEDETRQLEEIPKD